MKTDRKGYLKLHIILGGSTMNAEQKLATRKFELEEDITLDELSNSSDKMYRTYTSLRNIQHLLDVVMNKRQSLQGFNADEIKAVLYEFYMFTMGEETLDALYETVGQTINDLDQGIYLLNNIETSIKNFNEVETKEEQTA